MEIINFNFFFLMYVSVVVRGEVEWWWIRSSHSLSESSTKSSRDALRLVAFRDADPRDEEESSIGEQCVGMSKTSSLVVGALAS